MPSNYLEEARGIDSERAYRYGVEVKPLKSGGDGVVISYRQNGEVYGHKVRPLDPGAGPRFFFHPKGQTRDLWNVDVLKDDTLLDQPIIITEGELDALSCIEAGFPRTVSIPDGWTDTHYGGDSPKSKPILQNLDRLKRSPFVIAAGDGDNTGASFIRAVANLLDGHPVKYLVYPENCKDANDVLRRYGCADLAKTLNSALWCDPEGGLVTGFSDLPPQPDAQIFRPKFPPFDEVILFHTGFLTVVTGIPASGKSTFTTVATDAAGKGNNIRVAYGMFETPSVYLRDHLSRLHNNGLPWAMLNAESKKDTLEVLDRRFRVMHMTTAEVAHDMGWLREMMNVVAVRENCKIVVLDPWNELEHLLERGETMTSYLNTALSRIQQWSERFDCATVIVAHPAKMTDPKVPPLGYDISDSAAWFNKAAVGVTVHQVDGLVHAINWKAKFQQSYRLQRQATIKLQFDQAKMTYLPKIAGGLDD